jgi:hypothetical protein
VGPYPLESWEEAFDEAKKNARWGPGGALAIERWIAPPRFEFTRALLVRRRVIAGSISKFHLLSTLVELTLDAVLRLYFCPTESIKALATGLEAIEPTRDSKAAIGVAARDRKVEWFPYLQLRLDAIVKAAR